MLNFALASPQTSGEDVSQRKPPESETTPRERLSQGTQASSEENVGSQRTVADSSPRTIKFPLQERLLNAREVAARLGVSERWVRDHTTRRFPKLRGVKLGTLMRYRTADVDDFMEKLTTSKSSMQSRFGG